MNILINLILFGSSNKLFRIFYNIDTLDKQENYLIYRKQNLTKLSSVSSNGGTVVYYSLSNVKYESK